MCVLTYLLTHLLDAVGTGVGVETGGAPPTRGRKGRVRGHRDLGRVEAKLRNRVRVRVRVG